MGPRMTPWTLLFMNTWKMLFMSTWLLARYTLPRVTGWHCLWLELWCRIFWLDIISFNYFSICADPCFFISIPMYHLLSLCKRASTTPPWWLNMPSTSDGYHNAPHSCALTFPPYHNVTILKSSYSGISLSVLNSLLHQCIWHQLVGTLWGKKSSLTPGIGSFISDNLYIQSICVHL